MSTTENKEIRVLIVDNSFSMRRMLRKIVSSDTDMSVVGAVGSGEEAIREVKRLKPDVVTMDFEMPEMNGLEVTKKILSDSKHFPAVIMFAGSAEEEVEQTLQSLRAGAVDFILKPSGEISFDISSKKDEILKKIKIAASARVDKHVIDPLPTASSGFPKVVEKNITTNIDVVVIGASTGGPPIVEDIIVHMPDDLPVPMLVVQHMPGYFTKIFSERLSQSARIPVKESEEGDVIESGHAYIARGDFHMVVENDSNESGELMRIHLNKEPKKHGLRPAIDVLMSSVARVYGGNILGIILTGMGQDGAVGMEAIKESGGYIIVQDPDTAVVDSMPRSVIEKGLADEILPPKQIARRIIEICKKT